MENLRTRGCLVYGALDLLAAASYAYVILALAPSRSPLVTGVFLAVSALLAAGGVGMLSRRRAGLRLAALAGGVMLAACAVLLLLLVSSAAYLHGIYGGVGQAGSVIALLVAAVVFEAVGLLPALQLAYIRRLLRAAPAPTGGS